MSQDQMSTQASAVARSAVAPIDARIDALPRVGLSRGAWLGLMLGFFFANYDIAVLAITLPAMRDQLGLSGAELGYPVTWNLIGYSVGAYWFGHVADRHGRQRGLLLTIGALGVGGLLTALSWDAWSLTFFRFLTGCGMGAVLALCSTYIGEMAPRNQRGGYLSRLYLVGTFLLVGTGFASLPLLEATSYGWRVLLAFGALVLLVLPLINRRDLVESPRWLVSKGRWAEADRIVRAMEARAGVQPAARDGLDGAAVQPPVSEAEEKLPVAALFRSPYLGRMLVVLGFWFIFYIAMYGFASYTPLILEGIGIETSDALFITVLSRVAPLISGFLVVLLVERVERRTLVIAGTLIFTGALLLVISGWGQAAATAGVLLATFGIAFMATPAYTYTAEVFPTRARGTASAIGDGVGHLGGAVAPLVVLPVLTGVGAREAVLTMVGLLIASAIIIRMGVRTRDRSLVDIAS